MGGGIGKGGYALVGRGFLGGGVGERRTMPVQPQRAVERPGIG